MEQQVLAGFARSSFSYAGLVHDVYRAGAGPAVIVIHEMPGVHPGVVAFARRLVDAGYTVYLPSLVGRPGEPHSSAAIRRSVARACVAREFAMLTDRTSGVVTWLRALAARAFAECGGVGVVGMCFSGGFALATALEPAVVAAVVSQPALPAPIGRRRRAALGLAPDDQRRIQQRAQDDGLCVLGLRFTRDRQSPPERFETLRRTLGTAFESIEIDSSPGNPHGIPENAHSVLTVDLVDEPGHPTRDALDRVMALFAERLGPRPARSADAS
ncbi:dienelactone hydrolase [Saccharopolyspora subtropica]|uniref:Dienelactone hydrolase n=1 Tax=Saccharopolyspora thermophila TaxID=89367 RepID=A0A917JWL4_9PSEU|nr:dienelactone hydrolase family protein [Saccharopolyspora subtropica]GGI87473.1 dienelactone hydrolase [Saccharopolyspora subtropica]